MSTTAGTTTTATTALGLAAAHTRGLGYVQEATEHFVATLRTLTPDDLERPVPGLDWTAGQVMTHVQSVYERYTVDLRRAATPQEVAVQNADDVARLPLDVDAATTSIEAQVAFLASLVDHIEPDRRFPFHGGEEITMAGGWGNLLGELFVHGHDLTAATARPVAFDPAWLEVLWRFAAPLLRGWLRPEARSAEESWVLDFPFGRLLARIAGGTLTWEAPGGDVAPPADARRIDAADVGGFTLQFPYRRALITDPGIAVLATRFYDL